jgi:hypothetical protein
LVYLRWSIWSATSMSVAASSSSSSSIRAVFGGPASYPTDHLANREQEPQFGVDDLDVTHAGGGMRERAAAHFTLA